ncbi:MAG TPA: enoyl-CoA hydratase-related protein [Gemmatimonadales bacterium]|jgi:2-(1,2-epoxy-1,2-dihydrophenyl)acetyl-CoA isomerase|nr:enoyl-CoA hydratase-related protein [Gemmatimonadales bacterium]
MDHIRMTRDGAVGIITIDRRERFNAMDVTTAQEFRKAGLQFARAEDVRCVVVRGAGGVFCSGADLKYIRDRGDRGDFGYLHPEGVGPDQGYGESFKQILEYLHSTISEIKRAPKPFIAAVEGVAAAGGFGIAMACDLVFAAESARFEWAYHKTGLTGAESSTFFLPRLVGLRRAMELVFLNPRLSAAEARAAGLITGVFPDDRFEEEVLAVARRLAAGPTRAYAVAKSLINQAAGVDQLDYHLDEELRHLARIADGADFAEGLAAFFGKRAPGFDGTG